jgi:hypothetical protein
VSGGGGWEGSDRPPRSRLAPLVAVLALVVVAGLLLRDPEALEGSLPLLPDDGVGPDDAEVEGLTIEAPVDRRLGGRWIDLGEAPVTAPGTHEAVWTGSELIVLGGAGETAAYDPVRQRWRLLDPYPGPVLRGEHVHGLTWTGREVLALAKPLDRPLRGQPVHALDPGTGTWRRLPDSPVSVLHPAAVAWTGAELLFWGRPAGPRVREGDPAVGAAYDPSTDRWRILDRAPHERIAAAAGLVVAEGVLVWGAVAAGQPGPSAFAALYRPTDDAWEPLPAPPLRRPHVAVAAAAPPCPAGGDGPGAGPCDVVVLWGGERDAPDAAGGAATAGGVAAGDGALAGGAVLDLAARTWRPLPPAPGGAPDEPGSYAGGWTGDRLLVVGGHPEGRGLAVTPDGRWAALPEVGPADRAAAAWAGDRLLRWGGYRVGGSSVALEAWRAPRRLPPTYPR